MILRNLCGSIHGAGYIAALFSWIQTRIASLDLVYCLTCICHNKD
jgi:hypothetical protein